MRLVASRLVIPIIALLLPRAAAGSPLEDVTLGGAVFTGPTHPHASSIHVNPAALGIAGIGWHIYTSGNLRLDRHVIDRRHIDPATGEATSGPTVKALPMTPSGFLGAYWKGDNVAVGFGGYTPMAERFIAKQEALQHHTLGGHHYQFGLALAVSFYFQRRYYIGAGLAFMASSLRLRFTRDTALDAGSSDVDGIASDCNGEPCGFEHEAAAERYDVEVATKGLPMGFGDLFFDVIDLFAASNIALTAGGLMRVRDQWWAALAYQGPPGLKSDLSLPGEVHVRSSPRDGSVVRTGDAVVNYNLPHTIHAGVRGPVLPDYDLVVNARYQSLDSHDNFDIRMFGGDLADGEVPEWYPRYRGFNWVVRLQAGIERLETERYRFGARVGWERGAVKNRRISPMQVAGQNLSLALGGELRLGQSFVLGASYQLAWFPSVDSTNSAFDPLAQLSCVDSGYDLDECEAAREGRGMPTAAGEYRRMQHALAVSLRWDIF